MLNRAQPFLAVVRLAVCLREWDRTVCLREWDCIENYLEIQYI